MRFILFLFLNGGSLFGGFFLFLIDENLVDDKKCHANGDCRVSDVENGIEELEGAATNERHPLRPCGVDEGEIEHIHNPAEKEGSITALLGEELGHVIVALVEDKTVETAVYEVSYCSAEDQSQADQSKRGGIFFDEVDEIPQDACGGHHAKKGEEELASLAAESHTEGHAFVLDEMQKTPVADKGNLFADLHMGLDKDLDDLVYYQHQADEEETDPIFLSYRVHLNDWGLLLTFSFLTLHPVHFFASTLHNLRGQRVGTMEYGH